MGVHRLKNWMIGALILIPLWPSVLSAFFNNLGAAYLVKTRLDSPVYLSLCEETLQRSVQLDPTNPGAQHNLGLVYLLQSSWEQAGEAFTRGIKYAAEKPHLHYHLAQALIRQNRTEAARRELGLAGAWKDLRVDYSEAGLAYLEVKDYPRAGEAFRKMISAAKAMQDDYWMAQGYQWLGKALELQDLQEQAIGALETAVAIGKDLGPARGARMDLARIYSRSGKFHLSIDLIEEANQIEPANRHHLLMAGDLYRENGDCRQAIVYYRLAARVPPFEGLDWHGMAGCYLELGQYAEAAAAAKAGLEQNHHLPFLHFDLAQAYSGIGEQNLACMEVNAAAELSPEDPRLDQYRARFACGVEP